MEKQENKPQTLENKILQNVDLKDTGYSNMQ
jgi:hypothetical protein